MYLVHILLPISDKRGVPFPKELLQNIQSELVQRFGGLTAHARAPAKGLWKNEGGNEKDDIVIIEIMTPTLDENWWSQFRRTLEKRLEQEEVIIRAQETRKL
jgi:hypothetical protein